MSLARLTLIFLLSQGSESDTVTYVVGAGRGQTWQHVYTAVTRGKKHVIMLTRQQDLDEAIARPPGMHIRFMCAFKSADCF